MTLKMTDKGGIAALETGVIDRSSGEAKGRFLRADSHSREVDEVNREARFVASTNQVDRYGEVVLPTAFKARIASFERHAPFLGAHMPWVEGGSPTQIGTVKEIQINQADVRIRVRYANTEIARDWWELARDPEQDVAVSIGFIPIEWVRGPVKELTEKFPELKQPFAEAGLGDDDKLRVYTEIELLEVSQVAVPANSDAVQLAVKAAIALAGGQDRSAVDALADAIARKLAELNPPATLEAIESDGVMERIELLAGVVEDLATEVRELSEYIAGMDGGLEPAEATSPDSAGRADPPEVGSGDIGRLAAELATLNASLKDHLRKQ